MTTHELAASLWVRDGAVLMGTRVQGTIPEGWSILTAFTWYMGVVKFYFKTKFARPDHLFENSIGIK